MRVNITLLGMIIVDSWLLCLGARGANSGLQSDFHKGLATDLVLNNYGRRWFASPGEWEPRR
jgi:hypothetical protein